MLDRPYTEKDFEDSLDGELMKFFRDEFKKVDFSEIREIGNSRRPENNEETLTKIFLEDGQDLVQAIIEMSKDRDPAEYLAAKSLEEMFKYYIGVLLNYAIINQFIKDLKKKYIPGDKITLEQIDGLTNHKWHFIFKNKESNTSYGVVFNFSSICRVKSFDLNKVLASIADDTFTLKIQEKTADGGGGVNHKLERQPMSLLKIKEFDKLLETYIV